MLIKTKYIDCASKSVFNTWKLPTSAADTSGDIYWSAIVYIQDTGEVWTHGKLYGGFFSNADSNKVSLTIGGTTKILALDGHVQSYTTLTGSGTTADQAILSTGVANKWTLKTLGKNAFSNVDYLPADATAVAAEKVVNAMRFQYNGKDMHSFDGSVARLLNIIQGDNVFITGDSQGNVTIAADPGSNTVNTAGATNLINKKLFLIGAESQTTSPQTYSNQYVYIGTDNCLYSLGKKVLTEHQAIYNLDLQTQVGDAVTKVTTFDPNAANNSFTLVQGTNVTLLPDATNKKVTISSKDTTYDFYNLAFKQGDAVIDTYKPTTAPNKAFRAGTNVTFTKSGDEVIVTTQDTRNTAGATNLINKKLFLIGAESQTTSPQTYSNQYVYIGTDNCLYSLGKKVLTEHQAIYNLDLQTQVGDAVTKVTTFDPNAANNSFTLVQGTNVTLLPDATNKKVTISSKDTTYDFYNLAFKQGDAVIDTYKPTTAPNKAFRAGTNVTFTKSGDEVIVTTQDTRNTAGATEKLATKLFLTGSLTQTDNPQTYTNSKVYIGTDNKLYSDGKVVSTGDHTHNYAGATSPGGPALKVNLNPSGLLDATYGSYGGILQDSNNGPVAGSWSNRIKILHNNTSGYYTELAQAFTGTAGLWHRRNVAGVVSDWTPVIDKANFRTYLDATYVIRGNDPNVLTNYVRYSIASGLTMNWEAGNATPTHIWGAKNSDSSKAYVFNGDNIRAFANAVNRAGDTMTGTLKVTEIQATNGNGLVMWNGTTYTYLGMQAGTTYIRSGATDLQHRYNGTDYKIWDARNLVGLRTEHSHNTINFIDSRSTASTPQEHGAGVWLDFKSNSSANLNDGGSYTGLLTVRKYGSTSNWSGGKSAQLGFTDNSNLWVRFGTGTAWEAWKQIATTNWADGKFLPLAGGTVTGMTQFTNRIKMCGTTDKPAWNSNGAITWVEGANADSQAVSIVYTSYDSYRAPAGLVVCGAQGNEWFEAPKFIKTGSSDNYVLLGGGGHKALNQFIYSVYGSFGVNERTGNSDDLGRAGFWRDNNLGAYGITLMHSDSANYQCKIYHDYNNGGNLYMKSRSNGTWGSVYTIWNSGNFDPGTKVSKSGDTMTGKLNWSMNGVASSIGSENGSYTHYNTNASAGHWFNKNVYSAGNFYGGSSYNRILPFKDEINSQVGGSKSAQMLWNSWSTDASYGGAIQIREYGNVTNNQSAWSYSPAISFHWGNRYAKRFGMRSDGQFAVDDVPISLSTHTHNYVKDIGNNSNTTFAYSKAGMNYGDFTWLAGWNGYELRAVNKSLFAQASHTHDYIPRVRILNPSNSSTRVGVVPFNVLGLKTGYPLSTDPEFASGNGIVSLYNNAGNGVTVIERISDSSAANTTGYVIRIKNTGAASPGLGGFHNSVTSRANAIFVQIFRAKIPTGHSVVTAPNSMGTSYGDVWITDTAGTGKWEWYGRIIYCGESGSFSTGSHVYLNGNAGTPSSPLYWYISYCQVYDLTKGRYDGLRCRYADEVTNADTVDGQHASAFSYKSWWHWSGQGGQPTWLWGGNSENNYYVYNPSNFNVNSATYAHKVRGEYTSNGGQQNPNYFGVNWVGFRMMNTTIGTNSQYKDWIISDCYSGNDIGGAVAFGMNRQSLGAYLMGSDAARTSWTRKGTFWGDWNLDPVDKTLLHKSRVPGEMVDFYVYKVGSYTCTSTDYTTFKNQLFDSSGRGKSSVTYQPTYASSKTYTVNLSDFILAYNGISAYSNGMYTAGGGEIESNRIGSTAGANSKTISGLEMPKHAHWFGHYRSDNANDRDVFGPDGNQNWSTNGTNTAGQGGNWRTGYSGSGSAKDWRPKTIFVFKMIYAPQSW